LKERELGAYRSTISQLRRAQQQKSKLEESEAQVPPEASEIKHEQEQVDPVLFKKANELL